MPAPPDDAIIPFVTVTNWVRAAALCGFNIEPLMRDVGVDTAHLHPQQLRVSVRALLTLMDRCVEQARRASPPQHFPVVLGESFAFDYLSDVETFITTSPTLRDAQPALQWLPPLINPYMQLALQEHGEQARLVLNFVHHNTTAVDTWHVAEGVLVTFCKFSRMLLGEAWQGVHITLQHQPCPGDELFAAAVGVPVQHGQPLNALWFPRSLLDRRLRGALPSLHETAGQRVEAQLAQRGNPGAPPATGPGGGLNEHQVPPGPVSTQVAALLRLRPPLLAQGLEGLAAELAMHPRTLQRRLKDEGASLSALLAQARRELACQWLEHTDVSIEDISERLGFSDRRSFTQAFTRWTGRTPSAHRHQGKP